VTTAVEDATLRGEDWWGEDLSGRSFVRCTLLDVDLS
jgi:fluoroquinolone resistance protein